MAQQQNINDLLAAIQQLVQGNQALVTALQAAAPAGGAPAPLPPQPPAAVQFAEAPALANVDAILDYSTKQGVAIFDAGCAPLPTKYNLGQAGLVVFVRELQDRARTQGWSAGAQNITRYRNSDGVEIDIITAYGLIDDRTLKTATDPFVLPGGAEYATRKSQNNAQMWRCLMATLTDDAKAKVIAFRNEFEHVENNQTYTSAPLLLKTMMRLATLDNKATSETLRNNLRELPAYAAKVKNIDEIHTYFDVNYSQLKARGEEYDDKMPTLWQAYAQAGDATLVKYADDLHTKYFDGELPAAFDHIELMRRIKAKYDYLVSKGTYGALSPEQEQIIALTAQLEQVSGETLRLSKKMASQTKANRPAAPGNPQQANRARQGNLPNRRGKQKNQKDRSNRRAQNQDEKWKKTPPKPGEPEKKKVGDTEWLWCGEHMAWTLHATKDCRVKKAREEKEKEKQADKPIVAREATTNQGNQNFQAVMATLAQMAMQEE
jgi:hypothetical protein